MRLALIPSTMALAIVLSVSACSKDQEGLPPEEAADLLVNRSWMDRMPESHDERLHVYRFTPSMGGGIYQDRTLFAGEFELFVFEVEGERLSIRWPHRGEREEIGFRIERVEGPKPFDLKLHLEGNSTGPSDYYGMSREGQQAGHPLLLPLR